MLRWVLGAGGWVLATRDRDWRSIVHYEQLVGEMLWRSIAPLYRSYIERHEARLKVRVVMISTEAAAEIPLRFHELFIFAWVGSPC
eukprot:COSAG01_NODE_7100_length_3353_cov_96.797480_3_plen_86_part_00